MNDYDCMLNIRMILFLNDTLCVNLDISYLYFKSTQNTCYLPCYYYSLLIFIQTVCASMCVRV